MNGDTTTEICRVVGHQKREVLLHSQLHRVNDAVLVIGDEALELVPEGTGLYQEGAH